MKIYKHKTHNVACITLQTDSLKPLTLLTACKAFLHSSYCGESLGVFWQIVCNTKSQAIDQLH